MKRNIAHKKELVTMNNLFPERLFQFLDNPNPDKETNMNNNCEMDDFCTCKTCEELYSDGGIVCEDCGTFHEFLKGESFNEDPTAEEWFTEAGEDIPWCKYSTPKKEILCNAPNEEYNKCIRVAYFPYPTSGGINGCKWKNPKIDNNEEPTAKTDLAILIQEAQLELYRTQTILANEQLTLARTHKQFLDNQAAMLTELMDMFREVAKKANG